MTFLFIIFFVSATIAIIVNIVLMLLEVFENMQDKFKQSSPSYLTKIIDDKFNELTYILSEYESYPWHDNNEEEIKAQLAILIWVKSRIK